MLSAWQHPPSPPILRGRGQRVRALFSCEVDNQGFCDSAGSAAVVPPPFCTNAVRSCGCLASRWTRGRRCLCGIGLAASFLLFRPACRTGLSISLCFRARLASSSVSRIPFSLAHAHSLFHTHAHTVCTAHGADALFLSHAQTHTAASRSCKQRRASGPGARRPRPGAACGGGGRW